MTNVEKPPFEVADILHLYGDDYRNNHALPPHYQGILNAISNCRTAILGGHVEECDHCGDHRISYNSCRNRHCPKCQGFDNIRWVQAREAELLPVQYFHVIFTLPHAFNVLAQYNQACLYNILIKAATETLQNFADRRWKGTLGITVVLHTWGQTLGQHIHLHAIVTGGVLTHDKQRWINAPKNYLFKVENLSKVYREKFCDKLKKAFAQGELINPSEGLQSANTNYLEKFLQQLHMKPWVVYCKPPFAGPTAVLKYLSRYTHRIAISNRRIFSIEQGKICFSYKDYKDNQQEKLMTLKANEFIRRFLLHVLPKGFVRIRHFGLLAGRDRTIKLNQCRTLFDLPPYHRKKRLSSLDVLRELSEVDPKLCTVCRQGQQVFLRDLFSPLIDNHDPPLKVV
jgi:hypothetical protein